MRVRTGILFVVTMALTLLSLPLHAQQNASRRYRLFEVGTFGGPNSVYNVFSRIATNRGVVVGAANTADPDPFAPSCFDSETCRVQHAWAWRDGTLADLGALPGRYSSYTTAINSRGMIVGLSGNGETDPLTGTPALYLATVWDHGKIKDLGTFGGANSIAIAVTDQGFVMGAAENGIADTSGFSASAAFDGVSQIRAFGWNGRNIFDLGTLGGTGAFPNDMNNLGAVVGFSSTTAVPDANGIVPVHPFLWSRGRIRDLGTLGGNFAGAGAINNRGQVIGTSNLSGDQVVHPFLWHDGKMKDLGSLGGSYATGEWINDVGEAIGYSSIAGDQTIHAFAWKNGVMTDLGLVEGDNASNAFGINAAGQIVGQSWFWDGQKVTASHAFLWERRGPMVDLNTVMSNLTDLNLFEADFITDRGWIVARGWKPNGDVHTAILVPEDDDAGAESILAGNAAEPVSLGASKRIEPTREMLRLLKPKASYWDRVPKLRH